MWLEIIISSTLLLPFRYHALSSYHLQFSKGEVHIYQFFVITESLKNTFDNSHTIIFGKCSILQPVYVNIVYIFFQIYLDLNNCYVCDVI
jgi:hypothetical protein